MSIVAEKDRGKFGENPTEFQLSNLYMKSRVKYLTTLQPPQFQISTATKIWLERTASKCSSKQRNVKDINRRKFQCGYTPPPGLDPAYSTVPCMMRHMYFVPALYYETVPKKNSRSKSKVGNEVLSDSYGTSRVPNPKFSVVFAVKSRRASAGHSTLRLGRMSSETA
jgi:hypothetical protein